MVAAKVGRGLRVAAWIAAAAFVATACALEPVVPEVTGTTRAEETEAAATAEKNGTEAPVDVASVVVQGTRPVNLRTGPGLEHGIVGQTTPGTALKALGKDATGAWYAVAWEGSQVWIYGELVSVENGELVSVENGEGLPVVAVGTATPTPVTGVIVPAQEWCELVWSDEFEEDGFPNPARWRYDQAPNNWDQGKLHYYVNLRKQNARVEEGRLIIEARHEQLHGREYSSARLQSREEWTYGRYEVLAKLPADGRGIVSAIWLRGNSRTYGSWPASGEIDIMEHVGHQPDRIHATIHSEAYNNRIQTHKKATTMLPTARTDFNLYVLEWTPEAVKVYVNDSHYFSFGNERLTDPDADYRQWPFDNPHHMILNISVGGGWVGNDRVDPSYFPQRMEIEFVRVYDCGEGR